MNKNSYIAIAYGLCQAKGATEEEAKARAERKAKRLMRAMKAAGPLPQIVVRLAKS